MDDPTPLERAVDQFVDQLLRGSGPDLAAFLAQHPDLDAAERARLEKLARVLGGRAAETPAPGALPFERLGAYRLVARLGAGGMGLVYLAEDTRLGRRIALKVVRPELAASPEALARFEREARAVAKLSHEHIVTVFEAGRIDDIAFLAMEYVPGRSLDELFAEARAAQTRVPVRPLLRHGLEIARALEAAHAAGIVHRDVKPSNVRVTPDGRALLLDFGLAFDAASAALSRTGQVHGTLFYASPEQVAGGAQKVDARTDVWSLGVTLYEGLTGRRPFEGERTEEVLRRIMTSEPVAPRALAPDLPRDAETVVLKALEQDRERRYASAAAFAADLEALLAGRPVLARPSGSVTKAWKWSRRKPAHATSLALGALLVIGGPITFAAVQARHARALEKERNIAQERADDLEELAAFQGKAVGRIHPERMAEHLVEALDQEARAAWAAAGHDAGEQDARAQRLSELIADANTTNVAVAALREDILQPAIEAARSEFVARPRLQGMLLHSIAATCWELGLFDLALDTEQSAYALLAAHAGADDRDLLAARANLGQLLFEFGRHDEAEPHLRAAAASLARTRGPEDNSALLARQNLALLLRARGELDECEAIFRDVLELRRRTRGGADEGTVQAIANLGALLLLRGRAEESEPLLREAYERRRDTPGTDFDARLTSANNLGVLLRKLERLDDATQVFRESFEAARKELGDRHPTTTFLRTNLAQVLAAAGSDEEAEPLLRAAVSTSSEVSGPLHADTLFRVWRLGELLLKLERPEDALDAVRGACDAARAELGVDAVAVQRLIAVEVQALVALRRYDDAAAALTAGKPSTAPAAPLSAAAEALIAAAPPEIATPTELAWRRED
ncbi:MAG: serine/threonine-protein kinase [Planctomycetota bacterium]